ncbi:MAG: Gfo/Idh/MocA family oxidoreductase [Spirochaetales bacterium]|nr:Gfo/Idh/MocA family oxidoreductase [Spirochaetales bacterium]
MYKIGLIGIGGLGIRHLQALTNLKDEYEIYGVDLNTEIIENLRFQYKNINFYTNIADLPDELAVVIIATTSNVRRNVFEELIYTKKVSNIIFEKFLFQFEEDYEYVEKEIKKRNIKAWVNCPRREYNSFNMLKERLKSQNINSIIISGGDWAFGSNCVHFLDLIEFLTNSENIDIMAPFLQGPIIESKRKGFYEFYGMIIGKCGNCDFIIKCYDNSNTPVTINIETDCENILINESEQKIIFFNVDNKWNGSNEKFEVPYISQLTDKIIKKIVKEHDCSLPTYESSMKTHLLIFKYIKDLFKSNGMEKCECPVT